MTAPIVRSRRSRKPALADRVYPPWSREELERLAANYEAGVQLAELQRRFPDRTASALKNRIIRLRLKRPSWFVRINRVAAANGDGQRRTDLDFDRMRDLWENHPEVTAATIGERFGISKNAVIGYAARKNWLPRVEKIRPSAQPQPADFPPAGHCQFPIGHPGAPGFHFCGERCRRLSPPYCDAASTRVDLRIMAGARSSFWQPPPYDGYLRRHPGGGADRARSSAACDGR